MYVKIYSEVEVQICSNLKFLYEIDIYLGVGRVPGKTKRYSIIQKIVGHSPKHWLIKGSCCCQL